MAIRNVRRTAKAEPRPFVFPQLKVDGELWSEEVVIPNTGQNLFDAQQQAAQKIRKMRKQRTAAEAAAKAVPASGDNQPNSGASEVAVSPVMSTPDVGAAVREWLEQHLPSTEQLFAASASLVGLQGIDARVRDLVASFQEGLDGYRKDFTAWRDGVVNEWAGIVGNAGELLTAWGSKIEEVDSFKAALEKDLRAYVATLRGPQGNVGSTGMAGAATTVVDRLPKGKGIDFTRPFLKRDAVVGDICIDATTDMRYGWRWDGQSWERGPAMVSLQVRDVRVNSMDMAPRITVAGTSSPSAGGGGSTSERLTVRSLPRASVTEISDSSRWAEAIVAAPDATTITAAKLAVEIVAEDGAFSGKRAFLSSALSFAPDSASGVKLALAEYSLLGDEDFIRAEGFNPMFEVKYITPRTPSFITSRPALPTDLKVPILSMRMDMTAAGKPSSYFIAGFITWVIPAPSDPRAATVLDRYRPAWEA